MNSIKTIDLTSTDLTSFTKHFVGCLVLTNDNKILLQQRGVVILLFKVLFHKA